MIAVFRYQSGDAPCFSLSIDKPNTFETQRN
jgi:hypothetical protein